MSIKEKFIYIYIYAFLYINVTTYKFKKKTSKIASYFDFSNLLF